MKPLGDLPAPDSRDESGDSERPVRESRQPCRRGETVTVVAAEATVGGRPDGECDREPPRRVAEAGAEGELSL